MNIEDLHNDLVTFTPAMSKGNWRMGSEGGAGLGIISTINMLFVIGFTDISLKQRPHEGPHKKSLCFCDSYHKKSALLANKGFVICGVRSTHNGLRSTYSG
ncbi:hypothetical protein GL503_20925 [Salmonella enterica]|nr:hypothetical protein [Salmonella enterica]